MSSLNLSKLRAFCEVADASSFTLAARKVFRTQPALSRQITELETYLGLSLFVRRGNSISLTPAGQDLYIRARQLLSDTQEFETRAKSLAEGHSGTLRLGAHPMLYESYVVPVLDTFANRCPSIDVTLSEGSAEILAMKVESRELDFALARYMTSDVLVAKRLFPMYLIAIVNEEHRFSQLNSIDISLLREESLLVMSAESGSRLLLNQACRDEGLRLKNIRLESGSPVGLINLACGGHGIAILLSMVSVHDARGKVIPITQGGRQLGMWSSILWRQSQNFTSYEKEFINVVIANTRDNFPGKEFGFKTPLAV